MLAREESTAIGTWDLILQQVLLSCIVTNTGAEDFFLSGRDLKYTNRAAPLLFSWEGKRMESAARQP